MAKTVSRPADATRKIAMAIRWPFSKYEVDVAPKRETTIKMMDIAGGIFKRCRRHRKCRSKASNSWGPDHRRGCPAEVQITSVPVAMKSKDMKAVHKI
jgi:hypothetical protein